MTLYVRQLRALLWKELLVESRSREVASTSVVFALIVLVIFSFAFDVGGDTTINVAPGILWVTIAFAGVLSLGRAFSREHDRLTLDGLLMAPMDRSALYLAKLLSASLSMLLVQAVTVPVFLGLFGGGLRVDVLRLLVVLPLGTLGFAVVGTLFAAIAARTRAREAMLPILLFPVQVPLILAAVKATSSALTPSVEVLPDSAPWLGLLVAFTALFLALGIVLFDYAISLD